MSWEVASPNRDDWFGFFREGSSTEVLALRQITGGSGSGSKVVNIPATIDQGGYQVRLFAHTGLNVDVELARGGLFTVIPPAVPVVTVSPAQVHLDEPYTIRYSGFPLGSQVRLTSGSYDQGDIGTPFTLTSDPYTRQLVIRSGQVTRSGSPVPYTITSTVNGKPYNVSVTLIP